MSIKAMKLALEALENSKPSNADGMLDAEAMNELWHAHYAAIDALRTAIQQAESEPVLTVEKEPDYWSGGHFHEGYRPHIDPTKVWDLPIGTKLYQWPPTTHNWQHVIPGGRKTDQWDSTRIADYNQGWNDYRKAVKSALGKLYTSPPGKDSNEQTT